MRRNKIVLILIVEKNIYIYIESETPELYLTLLIVKFYDLYSKTTLCIMYNFIFVSKISFYFYFIVLSTSHFYILKLYHEGAYIYIVERVLYIA